MLQQCPHRVQMNFRSSSELVLRERKDQQDIGGERVKPPPPKTQPLFSHLQLANVHFNRVTSSSFTCHKFAPEGQGILFLFFLFSPSSHKTRYYLGLGQSCPNQLFVRGIIPFRAQVIGLLGLHSQSFF